MSLVPRADGEVVSDSAETTVIIKVARDDLTLTWSRYEPGESGPGPHIHRHHADCFYVLGGELTFGIGPGVDAVRAPAGTFAAVPVNVVHTFRNDGPATAYFLNLHAPDCGFAAQMRGDESGFDSHDPPENGGRPATDVFIRPPGGPALDRAGRDQEPGRLAVSELEVDGEWEGRGDVWVLGAGRILQIETG